MRGLITAGLFVAGSAVTLTTHVAAQVEEELDGVMQSGEANFVQSLITTPECDHPWMDTGKSPEQRAEELLQAMNQVQKFKVLVYARPPWFTYYGTAGHTQAIPELCVPSVVLSDAGSGVAGLQLGTTLFPSGIAQASSWNPVMQRAVGHAIGEEAYSKGINGMLAPGMNMARTPYGGRNFEYFGEDPYLSSRTAVAVVKGIQDNPVMANAKHFVVNDQENFRNTHSVVVDERTMRELYLPPFEAAVKEAEVGSIMCAYNRVGPARACVSRETLTDILRKDWGFDGFVLTDWGATPPTEENPTPNMINAGVDMEMGTDWAYSPEPLQAALDAGEITQAQIDTMVANITRTMFRRGLFDHWTQPSPEKYLSSVSTPEHQAVARAAAIEGTVMLKNHDNLLPLGRGGGRTIVVMGYAANPVGARNSVAGGGSSRGLAPRVVSPLEGIRAQAEAHGDTVIYVPGDHGVDTGGVDVGLAASLGDVVVVVAADIRVEGSDKADLGLTGAVCVSLPCVPFSYNQERMISAAVAANSRTVVVLDIGGPVRMPWLDQAGAVLVPWYGGAEHGNALASILYGDEEPSGRLPQTFPVNEQQASYEPAQYPGVMGADGFEVTTYTEKLLMGYRWYDAMNEVPLFPFGYGLGYTTFDYSDLQVRKTSDSTAEVSFSVRNTGNRLGATVPQIYVSFPSEAGEPPKQLKGFQKVSLAPGQSTKVTIPLNPRAFSYWKDRITGWTIAPGTYKVMLATSARDIVAFKELNMGGRRKTSLLGP